MANEDTSTRYQRARRTASLWGLAFDVASLLSVWGGLVWMWPDPAPGEASAGASVVGLRATAGFAAAAALTREVLLAPLWRRADAVASKRRGGDEPLAALLSHLRRVTWSVLVVVGAALVLRVLVPWTYGWAWATAAVGLGVVVTLYGIPRVLPASGRVLRTLDRPDLSHRLTQLAERSGVGAVDVYEWRRADNEDRASALLVGAGSGCRILLTTRLLESFTPEEIEVMVAHELAHHVRRDVWVSAAALVTAAGLVLYAAWHAAALGQQVGLPDAAGGFGAFVLVAVTCRLGSVLVAPALNLLSRAQERRADLDALRWTANPAALVRALRRMSAAHLAEDGASGLSQLWFSRHPTVQERVAVAERWTASESVRPLEPSLPR